MSDNFFSFSVKEAGGKTISLEQYKGKLILVVNVASKCGFTKQYEGLEALSKKYREQGLLVLGFPCNQFGAQEPGIDAEIQSFCSLTFGVDFPVLAKVDVNGENASPVYEFLKSSAPGLLGSEAIKWNFTKFLVARDGKVLSRHASNVEPKSLEAEIEKALQ